MSQESQESQPSIFEYARFHGLTKDHLEHHPLDAISCPDDFWQQLEDTPDLFCIDASNGTVPAERMSMDAETASILAQLAEPLSEQPPKFDDDVDVDTHRLQKLKQEPPLLFTDHESDMQWFARQNVPDLESEFLPLEAIDEEADEGLEWPQKYQELPRHIWDKIESEKLSMSSEVLLYLQQTLKWHPEGVEHASFEEAHDEPNYKRM
ncbi:MAG: hypothetical protein Q9163_002167 [Psora crenata]